MKATVAVQTQLDREVTRMLELKSAEEALQALVVGRTGMLNACASVLSGELQRNFEAYSEGRALTMSFEEWASSRPANQLVSHAVTEFFVTAGKDFKMSDIQVFQDLVEESLVSRGLESENRVIGDVMYKLGGMFKLSPF